MDRDLHGDRITYDYDRSRMEKIVDDPVSSYPRGLLIWLRWHLRLIVPANNPHYVPTLPTAS